MSAFVSAFPFLLILACPLMMIFMMKGSGRGKGGGHGLTGLGRVDTTHDARIAELEREVADLRDHTGGNVAAAARVADRR